MGSKFGRNYSLTVDTLDGGSLTINLPFTVEFDIARAQLGTANTATFKIYNLSQAHRNALKYNAFNFSAGRRVVFHMGYGTNLSLAHFGILRSGQSYREGVNFITEIVSWDGAEAIQLSDFSRPFAASPSNPLSKKQLISQIIGVLPGVSPGIIGGFTGNFYRPYLVSGSPVKALSVICGRGFFIDNGIGHALLPNEFLASNSPKPPLISSVTGLLSTPMLAQTYLTFDMLLEPSLKLGQQVNLQTSKFQDSDGNDINGLYVINSVKHRGTISAAVCGDAITSLGLYYDVGRMTSA